MLLGSEIGAALTALEPLGIDLIGLNCATGPAEMSEHLRYLSRNAWSASTSAVELGAGADHDPVGLRERRPQPGRVELGGDDHLQPRLRPQDVQALLGQLVRR